MLSNSNGFCWHHGRNQEQSPQQKPISCKIEMHVNLNIRVPVFMNVYSFHYFTILLCYQNIHSPLQHD